MNTRNGNTREQGVALLMTLGVLSLILILAMSFSFTARTELALSTNNTDLVRTRVLVDSGMNGAMALLSEQYNPANYATNPDLVYPGTATTSTFAKFQSNLYGTHTDRRFWVSTNTSSPDVDGLDEAFSLHLGIGAPPAPTNHTTGYLPLPDTSDLNSLNASWQHVTQIEGYADLNQDGSTDENNIVGRYAYIVLDDSGGLDPNGVMTTNWELNWDSTAVGDPTASYAGSDFFDMNADGSWQVGTAAWSAFSETVANPYRPGLSPQEIQIDDTDGMATSFSTFLPKATVQTPSGSISRKTSWNSWRQIAQIGANNGTAFDDIANWSNTDANKYLTTYFPYSYDVEAYRTSPTGTDYHRLDLWAVDWDGTTWDATTLADLHSSTADFWNANGTINTVYNPSASPPVSDVSAAAALNGFTDANVTLQTLLNLVDFCDTDSVATHLPAGSVWTTTPTQVGNEVQPYINEIGFAASYVYDDPDGTSGSGDETGYLNLTVLLEVAEIYGSTKPINAEVRFDLDQDGTITNETLTITGLASANDYTVVTDNIATIELTVAPVPTTVNVEISNLRVALTDATGGLADWSTALNSNLTAALVGDSMTYDIWYASTQVEDPRCNTSTSDWTTTIFVNGNPNTLTMGTLTVTGGGNAAIVLSAPGGVNTISGSPVDPSNPTTNNGACDNETVTDPVLGLSTAYIANRADITFWELGAVHRGEPWRTINLHNYTSAAGYRDYTAGDGLLLDQIKLGSFAEMVGRVNVNSPYDEVWKGVLYGIRVGQSYGDVHDSAKLGGTGTPTGAQLTTTELTGLSAGITTQIANGTPALDRGAIAAVPELSAGSGTFAPTTDRSQEELIGKIANLLTARQNIFTILVTAQSVRDVSTNGNAGGDFVEYNPSPKKYFRVLTEQRVLATVYRDAFTNRFRIARMEYLED